ncbi:hypothetical protein CVT26_000515 [Gymnopilus dilepis]|uniref:Uncharacterized protein n=1 Tax=Gymnopilus dilepis TaxID=231916 RepID=A0A409WL72_9AGAR|nr:hypothetical protein CVT26_000515 [Gymnopilus dilepis]
MARVNRPLRALSYSRKATTRACAFSRVVHHTSLLDQREAATAIGGLDQYNDCHWMFLRTALHPVAPLSSRFEVKMLQVQWVFVVLFCTLMSPPTCPWRPSFIPSSTSPHLTTFSASRGTTITTDTPRHHHHRLIRQPKTGPKRTPQLCPHLAQDGMPVAVDASTDDVSAALLFTASKFFSVKGGQKRSIRADTSSSTFTSPSTRMVILFPPHAPLYALSSETTFFLNNIEPLGLNLRDHGTPSWLALEGLEPVIIATSASSVASSNLMTLLLSLPVASDHFFASAYLTLSNSRTDTLPALAVLNAHSATIAANLPYFVSEEDQIAATTICHSSLYPTAMHDLPNAYAYLFSGACSQSAIGSDPGRFVKNHGYTSRRPRAAQERLCEELVKVDGGRRSWWW